jgi:translation initiation factor 2B subunit (eIF-2B alpha/beta/delta family)
MRDLHQLLADDTRGATAIFKDALELLQSMDDTAAIKQSAEKLYTQFPVMGLFVKLWRKIYDLQSAPEIQRLLKQARANLDTSFQRVITKAGSQLANDCYIITISHSSYVRELIIDNKEKINSVYCLESTPKYEGKGMAEMLNKNGISASIVSDIDYGSALTSTTNIIVGADLISDHFFINKAGTKELAESAVKLKKEFWILGDELRFVSDYQPENIPETFEVIPIKEKFRVFCI